MHGLERRHDQVRGTVLSFPVDAWAHVLAAAPVFPVTPGRRRCVAAYWRRVVSILPNKVLGVLGEHGEYPIERIRLSGDGRYIGSCSHDKTVKFWDLENLPAIVEVAMAAVLRAWPLPRHHAPSNSGRLLCAYLTETRPVGRPLERRGWIHSTAGDAGGV